MTIRDRVSGFLENRFARKILRSFFSPLPSHYPENIIKRLKKVTELACREQHTYKKLIEQEKTDIKSINTIADFQNKIPIVSKKDIFTGESFKDFFMSTDAKVLHSISTSSGLTSDFAFGVQTKKENSFAHIFLENILLPFFNIQDGNLLFINCLSMGTHVQSRRFPCAQLSVRADSVVAVLKKAVHSFSTIVILGEAFFLKKAMEDAREKGVRWDKCSIYLFNGGEFVSEYWRTYMTTLLQLPVDNSRGAVITGMGITEVDFIVFLESYFLSTLRRLIYNNNELVNDLCGPGTKSCPQIMHYFPDRHFVETIKNSDGYSRLAVTTLDPHRVIPLIRYQTGDEVALLKEEKIISFCRKHGLVIREQFPRGLPVALVWGRPYRFQLPGGELLSDNEVKDSLFMDIDTAGKVTGNFRIERPLKKDPVAIHVQLRNGISNEASIHDTLYDSLSRYTNQPVKIQLYEYADFPYGIGHDFERKNIYYTRTD
ncbi:MAG: hypothetical protein JW904_14715 [Spirochaetales bacterium]|nr:hypothetical protein [Spirochaetales bacterium]